ncbi:MAG: HIT domain-containing protein [Deltaproteobacteria bacterium]|nr:MAG: HIT domain-containing protein [Deltaproteobacteria bacterium]
MNNLWAPWRMEYITGATKGETGCFLCIEGKEREDEARLVLHRGRHAFVVMNRYPYTNGHLMVAPLRHTSDLDALDDPTMLELFHLVRHSKRVIDQALSPAGYNIGINLGRVAGAGLETHLHIHIVPRWNGDTNFMTVLAETRVISEHLQDTYRKLHLLFREIDAENANV